MSAIMFPKNLLIYRVNDQFKFDIDAMEHQLREFALTQLSSQDRQKFGWVSALPETEAFVHQCNGNLLLRTGKLEKLIRSSILKKMVNKKVKEIEAQTQKPVKKKEKIEIQENILLEILPTALVDEDYTNLFIFPSLKLVVVDAGSFNKAEGALALLRKSLGSLPVVPVVPKSPVSTTMTDWVKNGVSSEGFEMGDSAVLKSLLEDGGQVTLKREELTSEAVQLHLNDNKQVISLSLDWQNRIAFTLKESMAISKVCFSDILKEQNDDFPREDRIARLDADFALICGELSALLPSLMAALGGMDDESRNQ